MNSLKNQTQIITLLRLRCLWDLELFSRYFFPHHCRFRFSSMHRDLFRRRKKFLNSNLHNRKPYLEAIAAPRGYAKSTLKTLIFPIHDLLYQQERYLIIISATLKQAQLRLKNIKAELISNKSLKRVFAEEIKQRTTWAARSINLNQVQVDVFSAGTEIRGITYQEFRPTKIIMDDAEDSEEVESPLQREKLRQWFSEVVENLGDRYTRIEVIGTLLHPDSLLAHLLRRPDAYHRLYSAITNFSPETKLWEQWRRLFTDLATPKRLKKARLFFEKHQTEMLRDTQVLWKDKEDYYELMSQLVTRGRRAFFKEKQNQPYRSEAQVFYPQRFSYFALEGDQLLVFTPGQQSQEIVRRVKLAELKLYGYLDSALGKRKGDYAAIAVVGKDRHGYKYVLDLWLKRVPPTQQIKRIFDLHQQWGFYLFGVESNCFQQLLILPLEEEAKRRHQAGKPWQLAIRQVIVRENKLVRINALEPLVSNGWIIFNRHLPDEFFQQAEQFPAAGHDDGLDALAGAIELARANKLNHQTLPRRPSSLALNNF